MERLLYTGDLFKMDENGYLYFIGRKDDMLKIKGERVSPKEVENVLYQHDKVREAAVIGVPDEVWGHYIKAFVALEDDSNNEKIKNNILKFCDEKLENYAVPKELVIMESLPKNTNGKIDKNKLH